MSSSASSSNPVPVWPPIIIAEAAANDTILVNDSRPFPGQGNRQEGRVTTGVTTNKKGGHPELVVLAAPYMKVIFEGVEGMAEDENENRACGMLVLLLHS